MDIPLLNDAQNLIIKLLRKSNPELIFNIETGENNIPEIVLEYGIVSNIPDNVEPITKNAQKYKIPLDESAKWVEIKKWINIFDKYLKNTDLTKKPVIDISAQIVQLENMKKYAEDMNSKINKQKTS